MDFYIFLSVFTILAGCWNLMIAFLGLFPKFHSKTVATLKKANTHRTLRTKAGYRIPVLTRYTYVYTVNGKEYRYSGEKFRSKRHLLPRAILVYVKWFPRRAYPDKFKGTAEWLMGFLLLFLGVLFLVVITLS